MENQKYIKLSDLVGSEFTVETVWGFSYKKWDNEARKMLSSPTYEKGYRKLYQVGTDKGKLDLGSGQMGNLFEGVQHAGQANIIGATFSVKSNGKSGMEIRYYLNPVRADQEGEERPVDHDY